MPDDAPSLDLATLKALEEANLNGFPSERSVVDGAWVARLSPGNPARRVNSLNVMDPLDGRDARQRLAEMQVLFVRNGVPFHLRHTPLTPPELVEIADTEGWTRTGETDVWVLEQTDLTAGAIAADGSDGIRPVDLETFITAFGTIGGTRAEAVTILALQRLAEALGRVAVKRLTFLAEDEKGAPLGVVLAVAERGMIGIYDLAVRPDARRQGLGARLVARCLAEGAARGCRLAWLQVTAENAAARALYRRIGFRPGYGYHYRLPQEAAGMVSKTLQQRPETERGTG